MTQLLRGPLEDRLSRRTLMTRAMALGVAVPALGTLLAACGGSGSDSATATKGAGAGGTTPTSGSGTAAATATQKLTVDLNVTPTPAVTAAGSPGAASPVAAAPTATAAPAAGKKGGKITVLRTDEADNYDPVLNDANTAIWVIFNVYETLVKSNKDSNGLEPGLAEKWDVSSDGLTVTFNIRQGVKFSDGSDLTMDDIIWSLERARDTAESVWTFTLTQAKDITAPDDKTIKVVLAQPWAPFLAGLAMFNGGIVSKAFFDQNATESNQTGSGKSSKGLFGGQSMGTGPYAITDWKTDQYTVLTRNEHYWQEGLPYLDEIKIMQVPDTSSEILQIQGGDVDGLIGQYSVPYNRVAELQKDPNLQVLIWPAAYSGMVTFNIEKPPLNDIHFRHALAYATDIQTLIDTVVFGLGEISNGLFPIGALYWNPDQKPVGFDLNQAQAELAQSTTPTGGKVEVLTTTGNAQQETLVTTLKDMWAKIGVDLTITPVDGPTGRQRVKDHDFQMRTGGWTNDMIDPDEIIGYYILPENSENARSGWTNQDAEDAARAAETEQDDAKRRQLYYKVQQIYKDDGPAIFLYDTPYIDVLKKNIKGFHHNPLGAYYFAEMYKE